MRAGSVAGIALYCSNWFLLLLVLFSFVGMGGKALLVVIAVCWHEVGHIIAAQMLGGTVKEVKLLPFGGVAKIEGFSNICAKKQIVIAAAGPIMSCGMAVAVFFILNQCAEWREELDFYYSINKMLAMFNLLPAIPLDGGRILHGVIALQYGARKSDSILLWMSRWVGGMLIIYAIYEYFTSANINITVLYVAIFILISVKKELQFAGMKFFYMLTYRKKQLLSSGLLPAREIVALWSTKVIDILKVMDKECYHVIIVLNKDFEVCGTITETKLWERVSQYECDDEIGKFI